MEQIPDAPWIRHAENDGIPEPPVTLCPVCGEECETYYFNRIKGVNQCIIIGCENCTTTMDACTWAEEHKEVHEE